MQNVVEDSRVVLCAILRIICNEWVSLVASMEELTRSESSEMDSVVELGDYTIQSNLKLGAYLWENEEMMKVCQEVIQHPGTLLFRQSPGAGQESIQKMLSGLDLDFQELLKMTKDHIERVRNRYTVSASILTIEESRKAIKQAEDIGYASSLSGLHPLVPRVSRINIDQSLDEPRNILHPVVVCCLLSGHECHPTVIAKPHTDVDVLFNCYTIVVPLFSRYWKMVTSAQRMGVPL